VKSGPAQILVALPVDGEGLDRVRAITAGCIIDCIDWLPPDTALPTELVRERTVLLADFAPRNLADMARLRWLQLGSAGYEQLAGLPLRRMGVRVTNASGVNDVAIAEWCVATMLAFERDLPALLRLQAGRTWERREKFQSELRGRRVGVLGYGNIGREVARLCRALGMEVWALSRGPIGPRPLRYAPPGTGDPEGTLPSHRFALDQMTAFLADLDYLVLTASLNPGSRALLGARELRLLPRRAVLLNPARAQLVDEAALLQVLREGGIAGAALDSHYQEPLPADDPLWGLPNVLLTPHISGSGGSPHYLSRVWDLFAANLARYLRGRPLLNEVPWDDLNAV
jgi:phosphoglycerate dehydrogenase-like enzyme